MGVTALRARVGLARGAKFLGGGIEPGVERVVVVVEADEAGELGEAAHQADGGVEDESVEAVGDGGERENQTTDGRSVEFVETEACGERGDDGRHGGLEGILGGGGLAELAAVERPASAETECDEHDRECHQLAAGEERLGLDLMAEEFGLQPRVHWRAEETQRDGADREEDERERHHGGVFVRMLGGVAAALAEEHFRDEACHVERGEHDGGETHEQRQLRDRPRVRGVQNALLAPETREEERHARQRHHADGEGGERDFHFRAEAAELAQVLFVVRGVDDRAGAEEEQGFEESVRE